MQNLQFWDCHEEQIHIPGHIQSFGYLIVLDKNTSVVKYCSENIYEIFGIEAAELLEKDLKEFQEIYAVLYAAKSSSNFRSEEIKVKVYNPEIIQFNQKRLYYHLSATEDLIYLEFEKVYNLNDSNDLLLNLGNEILSTQSEEILWNALVQEIQEVIKYDRVMIYKFLPDGSGKVIAEKKSENLNSLLHVHFPETDIPKQARALYLKKRKRIFTDVYAQPIPIISYEKNSLDLSQVSSRAMSPIHGEYLKNSGVTSSFSTSIIINDELWGLVACQNIEKKHIELYDRQLAEVLTRVTANAYSAIQNQKQLELSREFYLINLDLKGKLLLDDNVVSSLENSFHLLKNFVEADGVALITKRKTTTAGAVPEPEILDRIATWALENLENNFYKNAQFLKDFKDELNLDTTAAGVLIFILNKDEGELIIWTKIEKPRTIQWAGLAEKTVEERQIYGETKTVRTPRKSFEIIQEQVTGHSEDWTAKDETGVMVLEDLILKSTQNKNEKFASLNKILKEKNEELDTFSYTVSHDLRTPLTVMGLNAQQLLNKTENDLQKGKIKEILNQVQDMTAMMNDILNLSRVNKSEIVLQTLPTENLVKKIIDEVKTSQGLTDTEIIVGDFPDVYADKTMMYQVFLNVIGNAVKYSSHAQNPKVEIQSKIENDHVIFSVKDNGIGISDDTRDKVFQLFSREDNAMEFKGSGVGLSIVKRLMNRMKGDVTFESKLNEFTIFHLIFKKP